MCKNYHQIPILSSILDSDLSMEFPIESLIFLKQQIFVIEYFFIQIWPVLEPNIYWSKTKDINIIITPIVNIQTAIFLLYTYLDAW